MMMVMKLTAALLDDYELLVAKGSKEPKSFQVQDAWRLAGLRNCASYHTRRMKQAEIMDNSAATLDYD